MPRYLLLGRLRDELQLAALLTLLIPTHNVAHGLLALKANANAKVASRRSSAVTMVDSWYDSGVRLVGVSGTGWSSKGKAWYEKGKFGEPWFDMWESRLRHVDLEFWDAFDEYIFYSGLEAKTTEERKAAAGSFAGKPRGPDDDEEDKGALIDSLGWPLMSGTVIELRGTLDESWSAALVVGYGWLTAQHEVAYVDILDILKGGARRESLWLSEHEWRLPRDGEYRVSQADVGPAGVGPWTDV